MTILVGIPSQNLPDCWSRVQPFVHTACDRSNGKYKSIDVLNNLIKGDMQLWAAADDEHKIKSIAITEVANYPGTKVARILACTGEDPQDIIEHLDAMEGWSKENGCESQEIIARIGWKRFLESKGYKLKHAIFEKEIGDDKVH